MVKGLGFRVKGLGLRDKDYMVDCFQGSKVEDSGI
jgi:hypothetical protein